MHNQPGDRDQMADLFPAGLGNDDEMPKCTILLPQQTVSNRRLFLLRVHSSYPLSHSSSQDLRVIIKINEIGHICT